MPGREPAPGGATETGRLARRLRAVPAARRLDFAVQRARRSGIG
jgi:hypothetical protein